MNKFDLAVKKVKVTPGSPFEQTMIGWSLGYYIPSFVEIGPPVTEENIFEEFCTTYGQYGHFGHVTSIMSSDFHFLVSENFQTKFV